MMHNTTITIWHNPDCGTSRQALALLEQAGAELHVVEYLQTPPTRAELEAVANQASGGIRSLVRTKEALYTQMHLDNADDAALFDALVNHPILINRPVVITKYNAVAARPPELALDLL